MPIWTDYPTQTTPDDADTLLAHDVSETVVGKKMKRTTWANIKAAIKALADTYYLGIASKAADSDKLGGVDSTLFARQNAAPVGAQVLTSVAGSPVWAAKAPDSELLDGAHASATPTANTIPIADAGGKLAVGWMAQPQFYPLTTVSIPAAWDGSTPRSTGGKVLIDLSVVFGIPAGVKAVSLFVRVQDSGAASDLSLWAIFGSTTTSYEGVEIKPFPVNDYFFDAQLLVPCDANGDIYYQFRTSGTGTMDVILKIFGYWL